MAVFRAGMGGWGGVGGGRDGRNYDGREFLDAPSPPLSPPRRARRGASLRARGRVKTLPGFVTRFDPLTLSRMQMQAARRRATLRCGAAFTRA